MMDADRGTVRPNPTIVTAPGARAAEDHVLADIAALLPASAADVALLARPIVVVVPSRSLRAHLAARLVGARGRAVAGIEIVTLHALAERLAARSDAGARRSGKRLLPVFVGRFAALEPALRELATTVEDGIAPLSATVRDLLDAGLTPASADALAEMLAALPGGTERERAAALARTAAAVARVMEAGGLDLAADVLRRAVAVLKDEGADALPARAVLIHGFADATALATDLIEALLSRCAARLYLDRPPDPADAVREDLGVAFSDRFLERLERVADHAPSVPASRPTHPPAMFRAPGTHAEVREVARRIRALLDAGAAPESIAIVARDLGPYALAIHVHFTRLAVPFSAFAAPASLDAPGRRVRALTDLLRRGGRAPTDAWLSATDGMAGFDLRLAIHACGAARIRDVAALDADALLDDGEFALPIRRGLAAVPGEGEDEAASRVAPRRRVAGARFRRAVARAGTFVHLLDSWPAEANPARHVRLLRQLLREGLGWRPTVPGAEHVDDALATLAAELPGELALTRDEFLTVVRRELEGIETSALGGEGGGVQVLSVTEARARTFGHLFLVGLNRDSFPRQVREDPLLPDRLRQAIERDVLPQIPVKRIGFDEERYLFAQLLSSAPSVTLSWQVCDDDGKARPLSPLVARLCLGEGEGEPPIVGSVLNPAPGELRPPDEHAVLAGLYGARREFGRALEVAEGESAAARLAVLDELDPDRSTPDGRRRAASLGPYLGLVGAPREVPDPRHDEPAVTVAENLAACPWQAFLRRIVRLAPPPDPLAAVPGVDALALGQAVHRALETLLAAGGAEAGRTVTEAVAAPPHPAPRPSPNALVAAVREASLQVAHEAGLTVRGLERVLEERARPFVEIAVPLLWPEGADSAPVLGLEVQGSVAVADTAGIARELGFRADLVEARGAGVRLTDFKTGRPLSDAKTEVTRHRHLLAAIGRGEALQVGAYALSAAGRPTEARYLYIRPDLEEHERVLELSGDDPDLGALLPVATAAVLGAWHRGALFPRLERPDRPVEPRRCGYCEVRDACSRGDSGARNRLSRWAAARRGRRGDRADAEAALLELWNLPSGGSADEDEE
ncbi:MAG TPA: PD-(D/E)XK nuclease family protein [Thermoanaerobaculaceae bacterium]|nr:PD-(D/E)XK nuclease family protein [Thermoanaerobaculaceae bacterium]